MANTCYRCGVEVPIGRQVCIKCKQQAEELVCPECHARLHFMHAGQYSLKDTLVLSNIFHCENCHRDWEQEDQYQLLRSEVKQKFWG